MRRETWKSVRAGVQRNGEPVTLDMLRDVVASFNPDARPPVVLGHPKSDGAPAVGRVTAVTLSGDALVVTHELTAAGQAARESLEYEGFSVAIAKHPQSGKWYLHHNAMLGEFPPAAETELLESVSLSVDTKIVNLSMEGADMTPEELKKLLDAALAPVLDKLAAMEARVAKLEKPEETKPEDKPEGDQPAEAAPDAQKQLSTALAPIYEELKATKIAAVKVQLSAKGLTDKAMEPLLKQLAGTPAATFAGEQSPDKPLLTFAAALPSPEHLTMSLFSTAGNESTAKAINMQGKV